MAVHLAQAWEQPLEALHQHVCGSVFGAAVPGSLGIVIEVSLSDPASYQDRHARRYIGHC